MSATIFGRAPLSAVYSLGMVNKKELASTSSKYGKQSYSMSSFQYKLATLAIRKLFSFYF